MRILNTCIRIRNHRSKVYKNLKKITLFGKHNSISLRPVRDIFVHKDNIPSLKYIRSNHVCLFASFAWLLFFQYFHWFQISHSDHHYLFHWYAQGDQSLRELHVVSLGRTFVHLQCYQVHHYPHCPVKLDFFFFVYVFIKTLLNWRSFSIYHLWINRSVKAWSFIIKINISLSCEIVFSFNHLCEVFEEFSKLVIQLRFVIFNNLLHNTTLCKIILISRFWNLFPSGCFPCDCLENVNFFSNIICIAIV